jgi:hypothetical protein
LSQKEGAALRSKNETLRRTVVSLYAAYKPAWHFNNRTRTAVSYPPDSVPRAKILAGSDVRVYLDWNELAQLTVASPDLNTFEDKLRLLQCSQMLTKAEVEVRMTDVYLARMDLNLLMEIRIVTDELIAKTDLVLGWPRVPNNDVCIYERSLEYNCARGVCCLLRSDIVSLQKSLQHLRECVQQVSSRPGVLCCVAR